MKVVRHMKTNHMNNSHTTNLWKIKKLLSMKKIKQANTKRLRKSSIEKN